MPPFQAEQRTAETYLAGIGASGALMASAFVLFVILVGAVTFDAWPRATGLLGGGESNVSLSTPVPPAAATVHPRIEIAGTGVPAKPPPTRTPSAQRASGGGYTGGPPSGQGRLEPNTGNAPVGSTPGPTTTVPPTQPPPPAPEQPSGVVGRTVSSVGNTVEGTTNTLGDTLGGNSSPGLGGVVGDLGRSVNSTVQGLVGNGG